LKIVYNKSLRKWKVRTHRNVEDLGEWRLEI